MIEWLIVYYNNSKLGNVRIIAQSKLEAVIKFRQYFKDCIILNIIDL